MPFKGILEKNFVEVGSFMKEGDPIAYVIDLSKIKVIFKIPENLWRNTRKASKAFLILPNGIEKEAEITYISSSANKNTHTYDAELTLPNENLAIPQGRSVQAKLYLETTVANKIPHQALTLNEQGKIGVKLLTRENIVQFYPVSMLRSESSFAWIKGLPKKKTQLIINGQEYVTDGQKVFSKIKEK